MMRQPRRSGFDDFLDLKDKREQSTYFFGALIILSYLLVILTFPLSLCFCLKVSKTIRCLAFRFWFIDKEKKNKTKFHYVFKVVQEYERAVIFRLGRILINGARGNSMSLNCHIYHRE